MKEKRKGFTRTKKGFIVSLSLLMLLWISGLTVFADDSNGDELWEDLPAGEVGEQYSQSIKTSEMGDAVFTVTGGELPEGLTLSSYIGRISGTPQNSGSYTFTITAVKEGGGEELLNYSILIQQSPTITTNQILPVGQVQKSYTQILKALGSGTITWGISAGKLPAGLSLNSETGLISGTPVQAGTYVFTVKAAGEITPYAAKTLTLTIEAKPASVTKVTLAATNTDLYPGKSITFPVTVTVSGDISKEVSYSLSGQTSSLTRISKTGELTLGLDEKAKTITVKAASKADPEKSHTASVRVLLLNEAVFTDETYSYMVTDNSANGSGKVTLMGFAKGKSTSKVKVPATASYNGIGYKVTAIGDKAFNNNSNITQVTAGNEVVTIGNSAFQNCKKLNSVTIGAKTTAIGENAFYNDTKLKTLTIKSTKLKKVGEQALGKVSNLKIKVPKAKVKAYTKLFKDKGQKKNVTVGGK